MFCKNLDLLLSSPLQDGRQQQEPAVHPRGHQLDLPELWDSPLPPPDLSQGSDREDGVLAHPGLGYVSRWEYSNPIRLVNFVQTIHPSQTSRVSLPHLLRRCCNATTADLATSSCRVRVCACLCVFQRHLNYREQNQSINFKTLTQF